MLARLRGQLRGGLALLRLWHRRRRGRRALARMDARDRADIGVHAEDARREAGRPFWRP